MLTETEAAASIELSAGTASVAEEETDMLITCVATIGGGVKAAVKLIVSVAPANTASGAELPDQTPLARAAVNVTSF